MMGLYRLVMEFLCVWKCSTNSLSVQHDTTVAAMAAALDVYDGTMPGYAAALFVELYSNGG